MKNNTINLKQEDCNIERSHIYTVKSDSEKYKFTYYKKRNLPKDYEVVGYVNFKKFPNSNDIYALQGVSENNVTTYFKVLEKKKKLKRIKGFIHIGDNKYLGIQSTLFLLLLLLHFWEQVY